VTEQADWQAGATWWRCALQVAPWAYLATNAQQDPFGSEEKYNEALIAACLEMGIQVIGFADHWRISSCVDLQAAACDAGIYCLPGFEATTKEGLHVLVHFDVDMQFADVERRINECGIDASLGTSAACNLYFEDLLEQAEAWGAVCTAAHVTMDAGLLKTTTGQNRQQLWRNARLHSVALSLPKAPQQYQQILANKDPNYARDHPPAVIYAADVNGPDDVRSRCASTWLKMVRPTARGLDLAFRSPETRVRLDSPSSSQYLTLQTISWRGGFLDGVSIRFNQDLNVLIGGRGTGKSTVVESIRAVLGQTPLTPRAEAHHQEMLRDVNVLGRGTKIEAVLGCVVPTPHVVRIERRLPAEPVAFDATTGERLSRPTTDISSDVDVYGQRELAEIADDGRLRTNLLRRFLPEAPVASAPDEIEVALSDTADRILATLGEQTQLEKQLADLDSLEEKLRLFSEAGIAEQLESQAKHEAEGSLIDGAEERVKKSAAHLGAFESSQLQTDFLRGKEDAVGDAATVARLHAALRDAELPIAFGQAVLEDALRTLSGELSSIRNDWEARSQALEAALGRIQRTLSAQGVDAQQYLAIRRRVDQLRELATERPHLEERLGKLRATRSEALSSLADRQATELRRLQHVAKRLTGKLTGFVRVAVEPADDRTEVIKLIRSRVSGRLDKVEAWIRTWPDFTPAALAGLGRGAMTDFSQKANVSLDQAQRFCSAGEEAWLQLERMELTPKTEIELNVGPADETVWRPLTRLSTGQKATALLLLLLLEEKGPLVIDQPEDDLDNQFIFAGVVPRLREIKGARQLIFSTHNANIPVLGDAALIAAMEVEHDAEGPHGVLSDDHVGSIDEPVVRELVEELLEGGRTAFENRRYRYGF